MQMHKLVGLSDFYLLCMYLLVWFLLWTEHVVDPFICIYSMTQSIILIGSRYEACDSKQSEKRGSLKWKTIQNYKKKK